MSRLLQRDSFKIHRQTDMILKHAEMMSDLFLLNRTYVGKPMVFLSHKHNDLPLLSNVIAFLKEEMDVEVYIDSQDKSLPPVPTEETANRIKKVIRESKKFLLLATEDALTSPWCNWELGHGDSIKYPDDIAILPIKEINEADSDYKGNEYLALYPHIVYFEGGEKDFYCDYYTSGYYVIHKTFFPVKPVPLKEWLQR
ncbi:MAG: toll/interleukin-1 receptor domain-containing protein [Muribaculum sp.]|nr:toll/interleukin-1 receptor domain-containing protein [Muribaculum sp.]